MRNLYHINNKGEPGICRAGVNASGSLRGCPFGSTDEHYTNPNDARAAFEAQMSGETLQFHKKLYAPRPDKEETPEIQPDTFPAESKLREEFDAADLAYYNARNTWESGSDRNTHTEDSILQMMKDRDKLAAELGLPTHQSQLEKAIADKNKLVKDLRTIRQGISDQSVGPGTDRDRLNKVELTFLKDHGRPSRIHREDRLNPRDVWEIKLSIANYEVDTHTKSLEELGRVSLLSSKQKRYEAENLKKKIEDAQYRADVAETSLATTRR